MAASTKAAAKKPAAKKKAATKRPAAAGKKSPARKKAVAKKQATPKSVAKSKPAVSKSDSGYSRAAWEKQPKSSAGKPPEQPLMKALRAEHRHIATVMQLFSDQLQAIETGETVDAHVVFEVMDYMATWPDRYHHPREDLIYNRVAELDKKAADDVDTLQRDHDFAARRGQELLKDIELWREDELKGSAVVKAGREYIGHMYEHMNVEEKVVFPHIESVLSLEDWRELSEDDQLRAISMPVFGPRVQREFRNMSRRLRRGVRRRVERGVVQEWVGIEALMESLEVLSLAYETARETAGDHVRTAIDDSREKFRESPVRAPIQCTLNNVKLGYQFIEDMIDISREVLDDLQRVNGDRKERVSRINR